MSKSFNVLCIIIWVALTGCATTDKEPLSEDASYLSSEGIDPYENFNRDVYGFNETVDEYVAQPVSDAYRWVTPQFVQTGVSNFFSNLQDINVMLNGMLQGKFEQGGADAGRFLLNSTFGVLGLFDVASKAGLDKHEEDFGQTLAVWGVPQGPYLVLPFLGPSTSRGVPGGIFDTAANPTSYVGLPVQLVSMLNARANAEGSLQLIDEAALDPYVFTREAFLQHRKYLISDGEVELDEDVMDLEDALYEDEEKLEPKTSKEDEEASADTQSNNLENTKPAVAVSTSTSSDQLKYEKALKGFKRATYKYDQAAEELDEVKSNRGKHRH